MKYKFNKDNLTIYEINDDGTESELKFPDLIFEPRNKNGEPLMKLERYKVYDFYQSDVENAEDRHFIAITNYGVFGWGSNKYGQLCQESPENFIRSPKELIIFKGLLPKSITGKDYTTALLSHSGHIYTWGGNSKDSKFLGYNKINRPINRHFIKLEEPDTDLMFNKLFYTPVCLDKRYVNDFNKVRGKVKYCEEEYRENNGYWEDSNNIECHFSNGNFSDTRSLSSTNIYTQAEKDQILNDIGKFERNPKVVAVVSSPTKFLEAFSILNENGFTTINYDKLKQIRYQQAQPLDKNRINGFKLQDKHLTTYLLPSLHSCDNHDFFKLFVILLHLKTFDVTLAARLPMIPRAHGELCEAILNMTSDRRMEFRYFLTHIVPSDILEFVVERLSDAIGLVMRTRNDSLGKPGGINYRSPILPKGEEPVKLPYMHEDNSDGKLEVEKIEKFASTNPYDYGNMPDGVAIHMFNRSLVAVCKIMNIMFFCNKLREHTEIGKTNKNFAPIPKSWFQLKPEIQHIIDWKTELILRFEQRKYTSNKFKNFEEEALDDELKRIDKIGLYYSDRKYFVNFPTYLNSERPNFDKFDEGLEDFPVQYFNLLNYPFLLDFSSKFKLFKLEMLTKSHEITTKIKHYQELGDNTFFGEADRALTPSVQPTYYILRIKEGDMIHSCLGDIVSEYRKIFTGEKDFTKYLGDKNIRKFVRMNMVELQPHDYKKTLIVDIVSDSEYKYFVANARSIGERTTLERTVQSKDEIVLDLYNRMGKVMDDRDKKLYPVPKIIADDMIKAINFNSNRRYFFDKICHEFTEIEAILAGAEHPIRESFESSPRKHVAKVMEKNPRLKQIKGQSLKEEDRKYTFSNKQFISQGNNPDTLLKKEEQKKLLKPYNPYTGPFYDDYVKLFGKIIGLACYAADITIPDIFDMEIYKGLVEERYFPIYSEYDDDTTISNREYEYEEVEDPKFPGSGKKINNYVLESSLERAVKGFQSVTKFLSEKTHVMKIFTAEELHKFCVGANTLKDLNKKHHFDAIIPEFFNGRETPKVSEEIKNSILDVMLTTDTDEMIENGQSENHKIRLQIYKEIVGDRKFHVWNLRFYFLPFEGAEIGFFRPSRYSYAFLVKGSASDGKVEILNGDGGRIGGGLFIDIIKR